MISAHESFRDSAFFFRLREPAERGPILEPLLDVPSSLLRRNRALAERQVYGFAENFPFPKSAEDGEFLALDATEIDGKIHAMNGKINFRGLQLRHRLHALALSPLLEGVAGDVLVLVVLPDFQKEIVHRIA